VNDAPAPASAPNVDDLLETVRRAGDGASDERGALRARQARALEADVVGALAALPNGAPAAQALRAGLRALGVTARELDAAVKWHRAQAKGTRRAERVVSLHPEQDDRRPVRLGPALHVNVAEAIEALRDDPDLYARDGALVRITREPGAAPVIRPHTAATLRVRLARFARFEKWEGGEEGSYVPCLPPDAVTKGVLEAAEWEGIRVLVGIIEAPSLRPDGSTIQDPGYDEATGYLYLPTTSFPPIPDEPTPAEGAAALRFLWVETSYDFPFRGMGYADPVALEADPDGVFRFLSARAFPDAWGLASGIMTIAARPAIDGDTPAHVYDASAPGSGKGLQVDLVCLATSGRVPSKLTWPTAESRGETDAEVGKMIGGEALSGAPVVIFDEVVGAFGGPAVNNVLTCGGRTKIRILGQSATPERRWTAVMLAAGNNISCRDNTHRRILMPRLESPEERPEDHTGWRRESIRTWVREHRAELMVAALTVLRAYIAAGRPTTYERDGEVRTMPATWGGGFESWSELVPRAILWAGGGDVLGCRPTNDPEARNEERDAVAAVLDAVARLEPKFPDGVAMAGQPTGEGITVARVLDTLYTRDRMKGDAPPDGFDDAREAIDMLTGNPSGRKPSGKKLGDRLFTWKRRVIDGRMLEMAKKDRTNARRWTVRGGKAGG
jgi:hypothetical protein